MSTRAIASVMPSFTCATCLVLFADQLASEVFIMSFCQCFHARMHDTQHALQFQQYVLHGDALPSAHLSA
jgi:hypothetical protein